MIYKAPKSQKESGRIICFMSCGECKSDCAVRIKYVISTTILLDKLFIIICCIVTTRKRDTTPSIKRYDMPCKLFNVAEA